MRKDYIAYGRGYSAEVDTLEDAEQAVRFHGEGEVYVRASKYTAFATALQRIADRESMPWPQYEEKWDADGPSAAEIAIAALSAEFRKRGE